MKNGLTLIELVLVLVILSVLTHLAVSQFNGAVDSRKVKAADSLLDSIADAAFRNEESFFADTGLLPRAIPADSADADSPLSLRELWERPEGIAPYEVRRAVSPNLLPGLPPALADASVLVPCGWRGPYLSPGRAAALNDPWGNAMQTPDDASFPRLLVSSTNAVQKGEEITLVRHLGSDGQPDSVKPPANAGQRDRYLSFAAETAPGRIFVSTSFVDEYGVESARDGMSVTVKWYQPCGSMITGGVVSAVEPAPAVIDGVRGRFCYIRVTTPAVTGMVKRVAIRPGDNFIYEKLRSN